MVTYYVPWSTQRGSRVVARYSEIVHSGTAVGRRYCVDYICAKGKLRTAVHYVVWEQEKKDESKS